MSINRPDSRDGMPPAWRQIAWNHVQFDAPADWEVAKIGSRYLMLETEHGPSLELKWQPVKGRFSHRRQLKRLSSQFAKPLRQSFRPLTLPAGWQRALADFETAGFSWGGQQIGGQGVILYCPECRTATLIQFYGDHRQPDQRHAARVLGSFKDHSTGPKTTWALYDIRARIPAPYALASFQFRSGEFRLRFADRKRRLTLHRWSPASLLLKNGGIRAFVSTQPFVQNADPAYSLTAAAGICEGSVSPRPFSLQRIKASLRRSPAYRRLRVWHQTDTNRILAVRLEAPHSLEADVLDEICEDYETIAA